MISIRHVSKSFGKNAAIDDFSLEIAAGEHVVLLGPSGSGKIPAPDWPCSHFDYVHAGF